jgi:hypothetical protein
MSSNSIANSAGNTTLRPQNFTFAPLHPMQVPSEMTPEDVRRLQAYVGKRVSGQIVSRYQINGVNETFTARQCYVKVLQIDAQQFCAIDAQKAFNFIDNHVTKPIVGKKILGDKTALVFLYESKPEDDQFYSRFYEEYFIIEK